MMDTKYYKFPSIFHASWSQSISSDDSIISSLDAFQNKRVIVSCKLDGENCAIYRDHIHARSIDSKDHVSRHWVKQFHSTFAHEIPEGWRICGENLYAKHSIFYTDLESYLYVFGIFNAEKIYLAWDEVVTYCALLGLKTVPVLYDGIWDEEKVKACFTGKSVFGDSEQEGYVVRIASEFPIERFSECVAKAVRKNHVQTGDFWMTQPVVKNMLKEKFL